MPALGYNESNLVECKGMLLSEDTDVFVISPNRWAFYIPELENMTFGDWKLLRNWESPKVWKLRDL